jgi:hypothetical protein
LLLVFLTYYRRLLDTIAFAGNGDDLGVMQEPVEDGSGRRHVAQEFAPFFQRTVAGHDGGAVFIPAHDDLQQIFAGVLGQLFQTHVVNDDQVGFEIFAQGFVLLVEGFVLHEIPDQVEDGTVEHQEVLADGLITDGLGQMRFADAGRTEEQDIFGFADKLARRQIVNLLFVDGRIETPIEVLQWFEGVEVGGLGAAFQLALLADVEFVLKDEFQELGVGQTIGGGFLQAAKLSRLFVNAIAGGVSRKPATACSSVDTASGALPWRNKASPR